MASQEPRAPSQLLLPWSPAAVGPLQLEVIKSMTEDGPHLCPLQRPQDSWGQAGVCQDCTSSQGNAYCATHRKRSKIRFDTCLDDLLSSFTAHSSSCLHCELPPNWVQGSLMNHLPLYQQGQGPAPVPTAARERRASRALWERLIY